MIFISFKRLHKDAIIPAFKTPGSAGADLYSVENVVIPPRETRLIDLGFAVAIPTGYEIQVRPRSGLSLKHGITILNSPGTIDSDYRGPMMAMLTNFGENDFTVNVGDRVAQAVVASVPVSSFIEVQDLSETTRGAGGFGSTGSN